MDGNWNGYIQLACETNTIQKGTHENAMVPVIAGSQNLKTVVLWKCHRPVVTQSPANLQYKQMLKHWDLVNPLIDREAEG